MRVGLLKLRELNWRTIAQDEASSVVWGMPKAAAEIGAAEEILPLSDIAKAIARVVPNAPDSFRELEYNFGQSRRENVRHSISNLKSTPRPTDFAGSLAHEY